MADKTPLYQMPAAVHAEIKLHIELLDNSEKVLDLLEQAGFSSPAVRKQLSAARDLGKMLLEIGETPK